MKRMISFLIFLIIFGFFTIPVNAKNAVHLTMKDGSVFTGTIKPSVVKFKTKYGEIAVNAKNIVSFSDGVLILKDQSRLIGSFSSGNITIKTATAKLKFPLSEVVGIMTETPTAAGDEKPSHLLATSGSLTRDMAKNTLNSSNLVITKPWCMFHGKCSDKTFHLANAMDFYLETEGAINRKTLIAYLSCLGRKNLVRYVGKTRGRKGFSWDSWLETSVSGEPWQLTMIGQKYLNNKYEFNLPVIINQITGIQFKQEETVAKVFFDATVQSKDNPFEQCFENYWNPQSLIHEPYAIFELYDDGWRFKKWHAGGTLKEIKGMPTKQKVGSGKTITERHTEKKLTLAAAMQAERERINSMDAVKKQEIISTHNQCGRSIREQNWTMAVQACGNLVEIDPENYAGHGNLGAAYAMLNEFNLSIQHLSKAIQLMPLDPALYINMIAAYERKKDTDNAIKTFYRMITDTEYANYFDTHNKVFSYKFEKFCEAVAKTIKDQGEEIIASDCDKELGLGGVITKLTRHGFLGFPRYDKYYILIEKINDDSTKLTFKLFSFDRDMEGKGLTELILKPKKKTYVNERAKEFLEKVKDSLEKTDE